MLLKFIIYGTLSCLSALFLAGMAYGLNSPTLPAAERDEHDPAFTPESAQG